MINECTGDGLYGERLRMLIRKMTRRLREAAGAVQREDPLRRRQLGAARALSAKSEREYVAAARERELVDARDAADPPASE